MAEKSKIGPKKPEINPEEFIAQIKNHIDINVNPCLQSFIPIKNFLFSFFQQ